MKTVNVKKCLLLLGLLFAGYLITTITLYKVQVLHCWWTYYLPTEDFFIRFKLTRFPDGSKHTFEVTLADCITDFRDSTRTTKLKDKVGNLVTDYLYSLDDHDSIVCPVPIIGSIRDTINDAVCSKPIFGAPSICWNNFRRPIRAESPREFFEDFFTQREMQNHYTSYYYYLEYQHFDIFAKGNNVQQPILVDRKRSFCAPCLIVHPYYFKRRND